MAQFGFCGRHMSCEDITFGGGIGWRQIEHVCAQKWAGRHECHLGATLKPQVASVFDLALATGSATMNVLKIVLLAVVLGVIGLSTAAKAEGRGPNILVMGEDADRHSVPRTNRIFNRVLAEISDNLIAAGFQVYDETAAGMRVTKPGRIRRADRELIAVARSINRPPIDVVVIFQIYASAEKSRFSDVHRPKVRVSGRLLTVHRTRSLGFFEAGGDLELPPLPRNCFVPKIDNDCLLEHVGMEAKSIAGAVGQALSEKLAAYMRR
jgi:hypothetical protein